MPLQQNGYWSTSAGTTGQHRRVSAQDQPQVCAEKR